MENKQDYKYLEFQVYRIKEDMPLFFSYKSPPEKNEKFRCHRKDIEMDLSKNVLPILQIICKDIGIKRYSKLKKSELLDLLRNMNNKPVEWY
jgi:hypothetical protein